MVAPLAPPEVQTAGVDVVKVTVSPDDAVALTVNGDCARVRAASVANVMVWLTLETARQRLTVWYQPQAEGEWRQLKQLDFPLKEAVIPVPKQFARLHN